MALTQLLACRVDRRGSFGLVSRSVLSRCSSGLRDEEPLPTRHWTVTGSLPLLRGLRFTVESSARLGPCSTLGRGEHAERAVQASMVVPVDPFPAGDAPSAPTPNQGAKGVGDRLSEYRRPYGYETDAISQLGAGGRGRRMGCSRSGSSCAPNGASSRKSHERPRVPSARSPRGANCLEPNLRLAEHFGFHIGFPQKNRQMGPSTPDWQGSEWTSVTRAGIVQHEGSR
jgi:hypothetical protein